MLQSKFHDLWQTLVIDFLNSQKSECLNVAYKQKRLTVRWNAESLVFQRYERIKQLFKDNYFKSSEDTTLDRHKRAAIIVYAFIDVMPLVLESPKSTDAIQLQLVNECVAFYFGLHYLTIDYKDEAISRIVNELNSVFFTLPDHHFPPKGEQCVESNHYAICVWKDLYFSRIFRNYNILTMSNVFYLLEVAHCTLKPNELYDDLTIDSDTVTC
jgi:hypothetical protein